MSGALSGANGWRGLAETAQTLGVSVRTVQNLAHRGELERRRVGRSSQYRLTDVRRPTAGDTPGAPVAPVASVASVASVDVIEARLDELEWATQERIEELEGRIEELEAALEDQRSGTEELAQTLGEVRDDTGELRERMDEVEAQLD